MSIKSLLMPSVTAFLLSPARLKKQHNKAEVLRRQQNLPHQIHFFHQLDDPYSLLAACSLPLLMQHYDIEVIPHIVGPVAASAAPEREKLLAYSRKDAQVLSTFFKHDFIDQGQQPRPQTILRANQQLAAAISDACFTELVEPISRACWQGYELDVRLASVDDTAQMITKGEALRDQWGHYLGATFYYGGEWYWGLDRLHHLERRLQALGALRSPSLPKSVGQQRGSVLFAPPVDLQERYPVHNAPPIEFFFSLRSPYSAIVAPRVAALARNTGSQVNLRFVLPMVMRGLPVPKIKRMYIVRDTAREAYWRGIPFGRLNDPVGRPTERGLALIPLAERQGCGMAYVLSFMQGVWSEGIDAGSDSGLRKIAERAGINWADAQDALADESWRQRAEANRQAMFELGLWGVPSFQFADISTWGQDRLWVIEQALLAHSKPVTDDPLAPA